MTYKKLKNGNYSYNGEEGVFRTIGGKRVFIKKGEDLATAMKNSGKFKGLTKEGMKVVAENGPDWRKAGEETKELLKQSKEKELDKEKENRVSLKNNDWREQIKANKEETSNAKSEYANKYKEYREELDKIGMLANNDRTKQLSKELRELERNHDLKGADTIEIMQNYDYNKTLEKHKLDSKDPSFKRQMLGRMQSDVDYYLGNGNGDAGHSLWAKDEDEQIQIMKSLYSTLPEKERPEWLTMKQIEDYDHKMQKVKKDKGLNLSQRQIDEGNRLYNKAIEKAREEIQSYASSPYSQKYWKENYGGNDGFIKEIVNEYNINTEDAKNIFKEEDIKYRYSGTIKDLQKNTNLDMQDILEIIEKIEKKNKK